MSRGSAAGATAPATRMHVSRRQGEQQAASSGEQMRSENKLDSLRVDVHGATRPAQAGLGHAAVELFQLGVAVLEVLLQAEQRSESGL